MPVIETHPRTPVNGKERKPVPDTEIRARAPCEDLTGGSAVQQGAYAFRLEPSCTNSSTGEAVPAVRLAWTAEQFTRHSTTSICSTDYAAPMIAIANQIGAAMNGSDPEPDAGTSPDANTDGGQPDTGGDTTSNDSCGCTATNASGAGTTCLLLLLGLAALRRRRRLPKKR